MLKVSTPKDIRCVEAILKKAGKEKLEIISLGSELLIRFKSRRLGNMMLRAIEKCHARGNDE